VRIGQRGAAAVPATDRLPVTPEVEHQGDRQATQRRLFENSRLARYVRGVHRAQGFYTEAAPSAQDITGRRAMQPSGLKERGSRRGLEGPMEAPTAAI